VPLLFLFGFVNVTLLNCTYFDLLKDPTETLHLCPVFYDFKEFRYIARFNACLISFMHEAYPMRPIDLEFITLTIFGKGKTIPITGREDP
jgi:hypothetical protein